MALVELVVPSSLPPPRSMSMSLARLAPRLTGVFATTMAVVVVTTIATKLEPPTNQLSVRDGAGSHGASACQSELDCGLNGDCTDGACVCDAAWTGPTW